MFTTSNSGSCETHPIVYSCTIPETWATLVLGTLVPNDLAFHGDHGLLVYTQQMQLYCTWKEGFWGITRVCHSQSSACGDC